MSPQHRHTCQIHPLKEGQQHGNVLSTPASDLKFRSQVDQSGCTALVIVMDRNSVTTASVGKTGVLLGNPGFANGYRDLISLQVPGAPSEKLRLERAGPRLRARTHTRTCTPRNTHAHTHVHTHTHVHAYTYVRARVHTNFATLLLRRRCRRRRRLTHKSALVRGACFNKLRCEPVFARLGQRPRLNSTHRSIAHV